MIITLGLLVSQVFAAPDSPSQQIEKAYQREYAYLSAERTELKKRLRDAAKQQRRQLGRLEGKILQFEDDNTKLQQKLTTATQKQQKLQASIDSQAEGSAALESIIDQGVKDFQLQPNEGKSNGLIFSELLQKSLTQIEQKRSIRSGKEQLILADGQQQQGEVIYFGESGAFGKSGNIYGALRPAGNGKLQFIPDWGIETAQALFASQAPQHGQLFLVEGFHHRLEEQPEQSTLEFINAGGIVGWIIVLLGIAGLLLGLVRGGLLWRKSGQLTVHSKKEFHQMRQEISQTKQSFEDLIDSILLDKKQILERFGTAIMVIAAVAPLLGLLGTVSGMIATFAIITEHGTGDPGLLSSGISQALITTQLGLTTAIPMLLIGNLLNGWSNQIFSKLTQDLLIETAKTSSTVMPTQESYA